jgi:RNA polymerase sigma-70 factor (ECF subfamily)
VRPGPRLATVLVAAFVGSVASPPAAAASPPVLSPRPAALSWVREPGAEQCPAGPLLGAEIERVLGGPTLVSIAQAEIVVEGRVARVSDDAFETVLQMTDRAGSVLGARSLRTWIYGICLRIAAAHRRRPHRRLEVALDQALPAFASERTPHDDAEQRQELARLDAALDGLDDDKRAVFVLYELEELTLAEIADAVGAPLPTVYSRLQAARKIIQSAFEPGRASAERGKAHEQRT